MSIRIAVLIAVMISGAVGMPWRRMFMSDLATAFAMLALID